MVSHVLLTPKVNCPFFSFLFFFFGLLMNDAPLLPHLLSRPHICLLRFFLTEMCCGRRGDPGVYYTYPVEPDLTACVRGFPEGKAVVSQWLERGLMNENLVTTC